VPIVLKSGSLNLLETSGSVKVCNGIALPLPLQKTCAFPLELLTAVLNVMIFRNAQIYCDKNIEFLNITLFFIMVQEP
jgi:hypothetical protein